ncbi:TfoX/Sxy family protein [Aureisphaera galaxeae]|uniref:TfoX/Sxy family protein n=1 Tax=Aureisphaera galaxeae TaxID=1538023 RepID=UPI00234FF80E|nr:TfoX/Sxy family protein [Aureisphaera galaxeae]MDC8003718.1 TfoX/Sxy family protein [Aureisphaera galaxeae]
MAYDQYTADRIKNFLETRKVDYYAKSMMGGLLFMVDEKMFCGIHYDKKKQTDLLMARIGEDAAEEAMQKEGCHPMDFTGRPMKGYVFVTPDGYDSEEDMEYYLQKCLDFNPLAKASKKRKKK